MLCPQRYDHLQKISVEGHTKKEISKIVFECAESTFQSIKDHPTNGDNAVEALLNSPDGGDVPAIDIDEHAQDLGESTGKHNMTYKPTIF